MEPGAISDGIEVGQEAAGAPDAQFCLAQYFRELAHRFEFGFDPAKGNTVSEAEMTPPAGWFFLARLEGKPAGCGALLRIDAATGEIKRMWTAPFARGRGVAQRIIAAIEATARAEGMTLLRLDTNKALTEAHALYRKLGFEETERYSANPYAHHWFRKRL
ncbi:MAG: GNAT family N-acetyltransferase [Hyphomicrobiales bacterium]|nr:GNAT family N-acetyltransferase [Hyphomicrobiales bacterium]MBV8662437.1 GNAT family N-acetyltransferase [Hyphomicrobiales bacterium]